jgi:ribosomal protein S18 acetylase RimI-like enzyme
MNPKNIIISSLNPLFRQAEDYFFRGLSSTCLDMCDTATAYMTGLATQDLNLLYIRQYPSDLEQILTQSKNLYQEANVPFVAVIPQTFCDPALEHIFKSMGYQQTGESVAMGLALERKTLLPEEKNIHHEDPDLSRWMLPLVDAFGSTLELTTLYAKSHERTLQKGAVFHHLSLYDGDALASSPVSSMTLSLHQGLARLDDVATVPALQGRGYATRLLTHGLEYAKTLGATHCFLEASNAGYSLYEKKGFKLLFQNNIYADVRE